MVNPHQTIEMFTGTMEDLMAVMSYEITLVKARRYSELKQVQRKKNRLSESYQHQQTVLQENPDLLATLAPEERDGLRQKFAQFREILADNMLAIRAAHDATEKVSKRWSQILKSAMELATKAARFISLVGVTRPIPPPSRPTPRACARHCDDRRRLIGATCVGQLADHGLCRRRIRRVAKTSINSG